LGLKDPALSSEAIDILIHQHSWPGNIRELENVIHHALLVCRENIVRPEDLHLSSLRARPGAIPSANSTVIADDKLREASWHSLKVSVQSCMPRSKRRL